ncbi:hypothetical protein GCM10011289_35060 [Paludibacterium paludis]|uniref:Uncharacterized protein n=1 Tax=Paludibacterium paludis TaxID=1225769 RepID=A0A918UBD3_9NEIS|nr:hypothetical protein GCM10011289_35060 [Paludibacterium paludis]
MPGDVTSPALAGKEWLRHWEARLARDSVCEALRAPGYEPDTHRSPGGARYPADSPQHGSGTDSAPRGPADGPPNSARSIVPVLSASYSGADDGARHARIVPGSSWPVSVIDTINTVSSETQTPDPAGRIAMLIRKVWPRSRVMAVSDEAGRVCVWVRDTRLSRMDADALCAALCRAAQAEGGRLGALTLNGVPVDIDSRRMHGSGKDGQDG